MRIGTGLLSVAAGIAAIGVVPTSAAADPAPTDPMQQFKDLSVQASQANEDLLNAQNDLNAKQTQLQQANAQLGQARQAEQQARSAEDQVRGQADQIAAGSLEGGQLNRVAALLGGNSVQDFLDRATLLQNIAADNTAVLQKFAAATDQATAAQAKAQDAQRSAQDATTAAAQLVSTVTQRKQALQTQITQVKQALANLSASQRKSLNTVGDTAPKIVAPSGVINTVLQAALSRQGDAYVWGAAGPTQFDCSGLTMWAYAHANISLPHSSSAQYQLGTPVSSGQWQPGDLLFFGSSPSTIHHVAMYVGNGEIVQAPTEGVPVQVVPISGGGSDYYGAKRIVG
ncbi:MAG TPA: NlpC/P60 family protein [Amycolatopsis sp.]|nr:NlpC/P60 family protein [Amycolatopsis sp.]